MGLIGGEGIGMLLPYAVSVTSDGGVTVLSTPSNGPGYIYGVDINASGVGVIGGYGPNGSYAAFVSPGGGTLTEVPLLSSENNITVFGASINDAGVALFGGQDGSGNALAGYAIEGGNFSSVFQTPFSGSIDSTAINSSGTGLIVGNNSNNFYAALIQQDGTLLSLATPSEAGNISSVALNDAGIGLIGGEGGSGGFSALVAPNGTLTMLNTSNQSNITSVALTHNLLNQATPTSTGPYLSAIYTQLAANMALEARFVQKNRIWSSREKGQLALGDSLREELVASSEENPTLDLSSSSKKEEKANTIWIAPFGDYVHLKAEGAIPSYSNQIGGVLLAYDRQGSDYLVGASLGYAFNAIHSSNQRGHGKIQEEMSCLYGTYSREHFWVNGVVWGGLYQFSNVRHTLSTIPSKGDTHGWLLSPHLEMASPWAIDSKNCYFFEPFFTLDWVNNWQKGYTETGSSGLNLQVKGHYGSLLQSEVGLRFYEEFQFGWGRLQLEEKGSYINQAPFHFSSVTTSFVAASSSFPIAVGSNRIENLGAFEMSASFLPENRSLPYGGFSFKVAGGTSYQSYFGTLFGGIDF